MYVQTSELPETLQSALLSCGYHRKDIEVEARETASVRVGGGSGYRGFVVLVDIATGRQETHTGSWGGANMFNPKNAVDLDGTERPIVPGLAVIKGSQGGGRPVYATIALHPDNVAKYLPAPPAVTEREGKILGYIPYKSDYRKKELERMGATAEEVEALVSRGFIARNRGGAMSLTTAGRNARGKVY